ncbi:MAG: hypothetical protein KW802_03490 [Candidatus Doudnabacteria bacterium]|nr:hypothetical protein [Candidatus Doudnabacteria bacterium]
MFMVLRRHRRVLAPALAGAFAIVLSVSCGGGGPNPNTPSDNQPQTPAPIVKTMAVPGSSEPIKITITKEDPGKNTTASMGQTATITYTVTGPSGYSAWVDSALMSGDVVVRGDSVSCRTGGALIALSSKADTTQSRSYTFTSDSPDITHARFRAWVKQGPLTPDGFLDCPTDETTEDLMWKHPPK